MTSPSLPVSRVVSVSVSLAPGPAQAQSLSDLLVLGSSTVIDTTERYRIYGTLAALAADFGTVAPEYLAGVAWFAQLPQPTELLVGRFVNASSKGGIKGASLSTAAQAIATWNAVTTGAFKWVKDGGAAVDITGMNFSGAANLNAVAAIIQTALGTATCVWNASFQRFEIESSTAGATSSVGFLQAPGSGVNISAMLGMNVNQGGYLYQGQVAETAAACVALFDNMIGQGFYGVAFTGLLPDNSGANSTALLAVSAYIEAAGTNHMHVVTSQEAGALVAVTTTDWFSQTKALAYKRTLSQYSSSNANAAISLAARLLTVNYEGSNTAITLKFKQEPGVVGETLNSTQAAALEGKNGNVFVSYNNATVIVEQGVMASGDFADTIAGTDWLAVTIQRDVYNQLYLSTTKIPQTDPGQAILNTAVAARCAQGVVNGLLAPGVWTGNGFGKLSQGDFLPNGFYVYSASFNTQAVADRGLRKAMPIQVAAKLAGAIHSVDVAITVNS